MAKTKKQVYDPNYEAAMLESQIRVDGAGEDKVVQELMSDEFVKAGDARAGEIAAHLAELVTGMKMQSDQLAKVMEHMNELERAQKAWDEDKAKFLRDIDERSQSLLTNDPAKLAKMQAQFAKDFEEAQIMARAKVATTQLETKVLLEAEPKETVTSHGIIEIHREGENLVTYLVPEVIKFRGLTFVFQPNIPTEVPSSIAAMFKEKQHMNQALEERKNLLRNGHAEGGDVAEKWNEINQKFNVGGDTMLSPRQ